ncbi:unnamed protein product [Closterium sp. Yama58-4]|nr:unnamed protein product [Closterium sp. Yama58-4]
MHGKVKPSESSEPLDPTELVDLTVVDDDVTSTKTDNMVESDTPGEVDWEAIIPLHREFGSVVSREERQGAILYDVYGRRSNALTDYRDSLSDDDTVPESGGGETLDEIQMLDEMATSDEMADEEESEDLSELIEWRAPTARPGSMNGPKMHGREDSVQASGAQANQDGDYNEDGDSLNDVALDATENGMSFRERKGFRPGKDGDWDWDYEDVSRSSDYINMRIPGDVSMGGIGSTREEAAALLQDYRYRHDRTGEQEQNFHNMPGVLAPGAGAGGEGEDFDEFQLGGGGQPSTLAARGVVDASGLSRAHKQGHGRPVEEQYEDSDQVFALEAGVGVVDNKEPGRLDHDQMVRQSNETGGDEALPLKGEAVMPARNDSWGLQENPLNVSVE